ncbi:UNVERIFIED_CONTAM: hypothetical protein RMT77_000449 [Armadillidium vulgare]
MKIKMTTQYKARKNPMYGNENGLPGLPRTTYLTVGGRRVQPNPPRQRPIPPPAPVRTTKPQPMPTPRPIMMPSGPDPTLSRKIDALDMRINSTEQGNRTLLDELMRLQQDIKANVRKNEIAIQEERDNRSRLEMIVRQTQSKTQEFEDRIRRCEDGIRENRGQIQQLSTHIKNVENMIQSLHKDQPDRRSDHDDDRHNQYRNEVNRLGLESEQLNKLLVKMREEGRDNGRRIDNMQNELGSLRSTLQMHARLLDETSNLPPPKSGIDPSILDNDRINTESKMRQLNKTMNDLQNRISSEASNREKRERDFDHR